MEIKHTHPTYPSEEARLAALRELQRACLALLSSRKKEEQTGA